MSWSEMLIFDVTSLFSTLSTVSERRRSRLKSSSVILLFLQAFVELLLACRAT